MHPDFGVLTGSANDRYPSPVGFSRRRELVAVVEALFLWLDLILVGFFSKIVNGCFVVLKGGFVLVAIVSDRDTAAFESDRSAPTFLALDIRDTFVF